MGYKVIGKIGRYPPKKFISRSFATEQEALKYGYSKTYTKDGNTKRKFGLQDWQVVKVVKK